MAYRGDVDVCAAAGVVGTPGAGVDGVGSVRGALEGCRSPVIHCEGAVSWAELMVRPSAPGAGTTGQLHEFLLEKINKFRAAYNNCCRKSDLPLD